MAIATGVAKQVVYKVQTGLGVKASVGSAQVLRRVTSNLELAKNTFQSNEIRADYQISDFRHGSKSVTGGIEGELSPGTYADFFAAALRSDFDVLPALVPSEINITGASAPYTIERTSGDFVTGGIRVGDVIQLSAAGLDPDNAGKNLLVASATATELGVYPLNGSDMVAEAGILTVSLSLVGAKTSVPQTGHTNNYYTIEQFYSDIAQSETFLDCKVNTLAVSITPTGMATASFGFLGRDMDTATAAYFTSPTAATNSGVTAGANGLLMVDGVTVGNVTGLSFDINGNMSTEDVVGSNTTPDVFAGSVMVSGQMTILFEDATFTDMFKNETEASVTMTLTTDNTASADFISFTMPRIKAGGNSKDDGQKGLVQTVPFTALLNTDDLSAGTTTISIQDSLA